MIEEDDFKTEAAKRDPERCSVSVEGRWDVYPHQCSRKKGFGSQGRFCRQHSDTPDEDNRRAGMQKGDHNSEVTDAIGPAVRAKEVK